MALLQSDRVFVDAQVTLLLQRFQAYVQTQGDRWSGERSESVWKGLKDELETVHEQVREYARSLGHNVPDRQ